MKITKQRKYTFNPKLYEDVLDYLKSIGTCFVDEIAPYFLVCYGTHIFNLHQRGLWEHDKFCLNIDSGLWTDGYKLKNARLHLILMVEPPGVSKSFFINRFFDRVTGLFVNTHEKIDMDYWGSGTNAGFVRCAEEYRRGMVCCEEIEGILDVVLRYNKKDRNCDARNDMFNSGEVNKRIFNKIVTFHTGLTVFGGTRHSLIFKLPDDLRKRFLFKYKTWSEEDDKLISHAILYGDGIKADMDRVTSIRNSLGYLAEHFNAKEVKFSDKLRFKISKLAPDEEFVSKFMRVAVGYWVIRGGAINKTLICYLDKHIIWLFEDILRTHEQLMSGKVPERKKKIRW